MMKRNTDLLTYRDNGWLTFDYVSDALEYTLEGARMFRRASLIRQPSACILYYEAWNDHQPSWSKMNFNPHHGGRAPAVHADGSVTLYGRDVLTYQFDIYHPNNNDPESVRGWGLYVHPDFD